MIFFTSKAQLGFNIVRSIGSSTTCKMPTIGVLGVTIPGAADCVSKINQKSRNYFFHHEHPNIILHQLNFRPTHDAQNQEQWDIVEARIMESVQALTRSGADFIIIPANTVHKVIDNLQRKSEIPIVSMLDVVADACSELRLKKVCVLGTRWTMTDHLYLAPFKERGIEEIIPDENDRAIIQQSIFSELIPTGTVTKSTMNNLLSVVEKAKRMHCDGIALACTELPLVLNQNNCGIPALDTTLILAEAAVKRAHQLTLNKKQSCNLKI